MLNLTMSHGSDIAEVGKWELMVDQVLTVVSELNLCIFVDCFHI